MCYLQHPKDVQKKAQAVKRKLESDLAAESKRRYDTSTSEEDEGLVAERELKLTEKHAGILEKQVEALEEKVGALEKQVAKHKKQAEVDKKQVETLEELIEKLRRQNDQLQAALTSQLLEKAVPDAGRASIAGTAADAMNETLRHEGLTSTPDSKESSTSVSRQSPAADDWLEETSDSPLHTDESGDSASTLRPGSPLTAQTFHVENKKIHLGNGIWMAVEKFNHIIAFGDEKKALREAAISLFSTAGLLNKSITGLPSNRLIASGAEGKDAVDTNKLVALYNFLKNTLKNIP
ncbi:uncharacterized protein LOC135389447 [Ornithodoros turicata]|uniref:uncharacterized protein LOC135389447 n=1 Tax=Ornithodoros turicata TaxID=34597 RepID=UPI0031399A89